jgi:hypothetical protein
MRIARSRSAGENSSHVKDDGAGVCATVCVPQTQQVFGSAPKEHAQEQKTPPAHTHNSDGHRHDIGKEVYTYLPPCVYVCYFISRHENQIENASLQDSRTRSPLHLLPERQSLPSDAQEARKRSRRCRCWIETEEKDNATPFPFHSNQNIK